MVLFDDPLLENHYYSEHLGVRYVKSYFLLLGHLTAFLHILSASEAGEIQFLDMRNGNHASLTTYAHTRTHFMFWLFSDIHHLLRVVKQNNSSKSLAWRVHNYAPSDSIQPPWPRRLDLWVASHFIHIRCYLLLVLLMLSSLSMLMTTLKRDECMFFHDYLLDNRYSMEAATHDSPRISNYSRNIWDGHTRYNTHGEGVF